MPPSEGRGIWWTSALKNVPTFARSNLACGTGLVQNGVDPSGAPTCIAPLPPLTLIAQQPYGGGPTVLTVPPGTYLVAATMHLPQGSSCTLSANGAPQGPIVQSVPANGVVPAFLLQVPNGANVAVDCVDSLAKDAVLIATPLRTS